MHGIANQIDTISIDGNQTDMYGLANQIDTMSIDGNLTDTISINGKSHRYIYGVDNLRTKSIHTVSINENHIDTLSL